MVRCWALWLAFLGLPCGVCAHQLDEYLQATLVSIETGEIRLQMNFTPGVAVAEQVLGLIDRNHDGLISTNESAAYAELVKRDLVVQLDGETVELKRVAVNCPELAELRTGSGIVQLEYAIMPGSLGAGLHAFTLNNRHLPGISVYLFNAAQPASGAIQITGQKRNQNQSAGEIVFEFQPPRATRIAGTTIGLAVLVGVFGVGVWRARRRPKISSR